jgi:type IV pilus assembly protein PilO
MAFMPQDPAKQKQILFGLLPLLALFVFYYYVHSPRTLEIEEHEIRLQTLEQKNTVAQGIAARSGPELEQRLAIYEQHMERLEQLIPRREEVPGLLNSVTLRAQDAGVDLAGYRPASEEAGAHYSRQVYEINVLGSFHNVGSFLSQIGSLPRIITPTSLNLSVQQGAETRDGSQKLLASFRIETYVLPEPGDLQDDTVTARSE